MTNRVHDELTKIRRAELPGGLWDRALEGPRMAPLPPRDGSRVPAIVVGVLVFVLAAGLAWTAFRQPSATTPMGTVDVPRLGETAAAFAADGHPVFVVHHEDGTISVVDGFSSHRPWGFNDMVTWCSATRRFVEPAHGVHFDEDGTWIEGPAPFGLSTFEYEVASEGASGVPRTIRIGEMLDPNPAGSAHEASGDYDLCPAPEGSSAALGGHTYDEDRIYTPAAAVSAAPEGYVPVRGTLLVQTPSTGGDPEDPWARLCGQIVDGACVDGAVVINIDALGLLENVLEPSPGSAYEEEQVYVTRVQDGVLVGLGGLLSELLADVPLEET